VEDHRLIIEHVVPSGPIRLQPERHLNRELRFYIILYITAAYVRVRKNLTVIQALPAVCDVCADNGTVTASCSGENQSDRKILSP
jgi:hypothetical protein